MDHSKTDFLFPHGDTETSAGRICKIFHGTGPVQAAFIMFFIFHLFLFFDPGDLCLVDPLCLCQKVLQLFLIDGTGLRIGPGTGTDNSQRAQRLVFCGQTRQQSIRILFPQLFHRIRQTGQIRDFFCRPFVSQKKRKPEPERKVVKLSLFPTCFHKVREQCILPAHTGGNLTQIHKHAFFLIRISGETVQHQKIRSRTGHDPGVQILDGILSGHAAS